MQPDESLSRLSCKRNRDGQLTGDVADREQFAQLKAYIFRVLSKLIDQIASGEVTPNPYTRGSSYSACSFCPYRDICHYATVKDRRNYKTMTAQRFWEEIGKELKDNG